MNWIIWIILIIIMYWRIREEYYRIVNVIIIKVITHTHIIPLPEIPNTNWISLHQSIIMSHSHIYHHHLDLIKNNITFNGHLLMNALIGRSNMLTHCLGSLTGTWFTEQQHTPHSPGHHHKMYPPCHKVNNTCHAHHSPPPPAQLLHSTGSVNCTNKLSHTLGSNV